MPTKDEQFPSKWCRASDIDALGGSVVVRIVGCALETVGSGARAEKKVVLRFLGNVVKPLIIGSQTNWTAMEEVTGCQDSDDWTGTIELYSVDVLGPQGPTRGTRIRKPKPEPKPVKKAASKPATSPPPSPSIPPGNVFEEPNEDEPPI